MEMSLDEAIKHAEEVAEDKEINVENQDPLFPNDIEECKKCAEEHRQLAEWLKELKQYKEQEPCEDAISRSKVLDGKVIHQFCNGVEIIDSYAVPVEYIKQLPSVTPAEKVGHWTRELIRNEYGGCIGAKMICSECGQDNGYDKGMKFCPNCGAKMQEVKG